MSMLADRKRKQKWVILDRNVNKTNNWSKDSNKFGQKLMERMGWKEGKGLGRNEDGLTDYVKVAYKNNIKGVGFKDSVEWSAQQDNFNSLLGELSNSNSNDGVEDKQQEIKSLEEKSQNSRARVHYKKFTRGKDLSRYSQKDLANIFGKKTLVETRKDAVDVQENTTNNKELLTISGVSMVDYFKNKMTSNLNKFKTNEDFNDSDNEQVTYGFGFNTPSLNSTESSSCEVSVAKKNKKSKHKNGKDQKNMFVSYVADENDDVTTKKRKGDTLETSDEVQHTPSKKKLKFEASPSEISKANKKSKKIMKNEDLSNLGLTNPAFEPLSSNITIKKHVLDTIIENDTESNSNELQTTINENNSKVKEKKSKCKDEPNDTEVSIEHNQAEEPKRKKNKKKQNIDSNSFAIDNPTFNTSIEISEEQEVKRKKKKKSKGLDNSALNDSQLNKTQNDVILQNGDLDNTNGDFEVKRKKKKKSKGLDNLAINLDDSVPDLAKSEPQKIQNEDKNLKSCSERESAQNYEVKRKRKKSKGMVNPTLNVSQSNSSLGELQENKSLKNGIENTALEISDCDIMLNVTDEPVKTTITPKTDKNTPRNKSKNVRFGKTNQEFIISARSPGDIDKRNELYDINTKVIQDGLRDLKKQKKISSDNQSFDIKSVDKIDFCDDGFSKSPRKFTNTGIDNPGFDVKAQNVEESVNSLTKTIDNYQAEVENGINESKMKKTMQEDTMVGEFHNSDGENEVRPEGVKLRFKYARFSTKLPVWAKRNDVSACLAKKSYKHLIRGDIVLGFKKTNLHKIDGYAHSKPT